MKYVASCSFGKDSLAMILKLLELNYPLDEVIYYNTGAEFKSIDNNKNRLIPILEKNNIVFTELNPKEDFFYTMLEREVKHNDGTITNGYMWCGGVTRWGTSNKVNAIKEHYKKYGDEFVIEYVGIAIDEQERILRERERERTKNFKIYPLAEWGMTEKDCLNYCYKNGWNWEENGIDLYKVLDRVSCWCCWNKNLKELKNMYLYLPEYWERLKNLQSKIKIPFKNNATIFDLEKRFEEEEQNQLFDKSDYIQLINQRGNYESL